MRFAILRRGANRAKFLRSNFLFQKRTGAKTQAKFIERSNEIKGAILIENNKELYIKFSSGEIFVISSNGLLALLNSQIKFSGSIGKKELVSHS